MPADIHHDVGIKRTIAPQTCGTTGTGRTGKVIDRAGYDGVEFIFEYGSITATNATVLPVVKEGDVTGTMTSIADADLLGTEVLAGIAAAATRTSDVSKNVTKRLGYIGAKRYVSANLVPTVTAAAVVGAHVLLTRARNRPVAT